MSLTGSYAEYTLCDADNIGKLPESASFEHGCMVGIPYLTAYRALFQKYVSKSLFCVILRS